jgi:thiosulfate/3-mercaptopyruvate sulfurtransferase
VNETKHALVDTDWLAANLDNPEIAIVEVDEDTSAYSGGHIPGAVALDWEHDLHDSPRRDFVSAAQLAAVLAAKGVSSDQRIVLYGGNNNWFAAYAYWLCKLRGIESVTLLDGGRKKWELEDRPTTTATGEAGPAEFSTGIERTELRIFRDELIDLLGTDAFEMIDVRSPAEFSGEVMAPDHLPQEQPYVAGHIPGAANIPWSLAAEDDGSFKSIEDLADLYGAKGIAVTDSVVAYCRIGERSSHTWFVLHEILGYPDVRNYDGSWTEYGSLVNVPVDVGD